MGYTGFRQDSYLQFICRLFLSQRSSFKSKNTWHWRTNTVLRIKFNADCVSTKMLIFSYNNVLIHPNVTVQHLKSIPFVQKAWKTCVHTLVSNKNQSFPQAKGFMHGLVQKILEIFERVANKILLPGANYTYMYNLFTYHVWISACEWGFRCIHNFNRI